MHSRLTLQPPRESGDTLELAATFEHHNTPHRLWWQLSRAHASALTDWADPWVVGLLFPMMQVGGKITIEGKVSPSLLQNLDRFVTIWRAWFPDRYRPLELVAAEEIESPIPTDAHALLPFSCGVDSCFTALRHHRSLLGRRNQSLTTGVVMHGFDIWLNEPNAAAIYQGLHSRARAMLHSLHMTCIPMTSNFHELPTVWADSHATHLVSGLMLLGNQFSGALIPNSISYRHIATPWGSHPLTDPDLGSRHFPVTDDGAEVSRIDKLTLLRDWPEALTHLRVCYQNPGTVENCCRCEKCIINILTCRAIGIPLPKAFPHDATNRQIAAIRVSSLVEESWIDLLHTIKRTGNTHTSWARAVYAATRATAYRKKFNFLKRPFIPFRNMVRTLVRGSALSRGERAYKPGHRTP